MHRKPKIHYGVKRARGPGAFCGARVPQSRLTILRQGATCKLCTQVDRSRWGFRGIKY